MEAAKRVAELCTIHATFHQPPTIDISGSATPPLTTSGAPSDAVEHAGR
jgi:hypothetical protein